MLNPPLLLHNIISDLIKSSSNLSTVIHLYWLIFWQVYHINPVQKQYLVYVIGCPVSQISAFISHLDGKRKLPRNFGSQSARPKKGFPTRVPTTLSAIRVYERTSGDGLVRGTRQWAGLREVLHPGLRVCPLSSIYWLVN